MAVKHGDMDRFIVTGSDITVHRKANSKAAGVNAHFHGTPGDPGYPAMHPKGGTKGKRKTEWGGVVGSDHFSEEEQYAALTRYIDESAGINSWLREGSVQHDDLSEQDAEKYAAAMMDMVEIQEPERLGTFQYRGMRTDPFKGLKPGDEFHDRGFVSTTDKMAVAKDFAGSNGGIIVRIKVPAGTRVLNVDKVGATDLNRIERESILQAGTRFRLVSAKAPGSTSPVDYVLEIIQ